MLRWAELLRAKGEIPFKKSKQREASPIFPRRGDIGETDGCVTANGLTVEIMMPFT
jgi:hypothetical protein